MPRRGKRSRPRVRPGTGFYLLLTQQTLRGYFDRLCPLLRKGGGTVYVSRRNTRRQLGLEKSFFPRPVPCLISRPRGQSP